MPGCPSLVPFTTGRALGDGGIERPRAGLRGPRPPGTGARRSGTGDAILGCGLEVPFALKPGSIDSNVLARTFLRSQQHRSSRDSRCSRCYYNEGACCARGTAGSFLCQTLRVVPDVSRWRCLWGNECCTQVVCVPAGRFAAVSRGMLTDSCRAKEENERWKAGGRAVGRAAWRTRPRVTLAGHESWAGAARRRQARLGAGRAAKR